MTTPTLPRPASRVARRVAAVFAVVALGAGPAVLLATTAQAAEARSLSWSASLGGRDVGSATSNRPVVLDPGAGTALTVKVQNTGTVPVKVRAAVLEGRVIGLPFFSYRTRLDLTLQPGQAQERVVGLDLSDLGDQATGLIPARIRLIGDGREVLANQSFVSDVRGRAMSVYGIFGLVIAAVTVLLLLGLVLTLVRGRLPANRWQRAMQFLPAGVGVGFVATFTLSATRILSPSPTRWVPLVLACAAIAFVLGYLAPGPDADDDDAADAVPRQRGRRAVAATAAVGAGGAGAIFADRQADAGGASTYDDGGVHGGAQGDGAPH
jgi:hypothetical protein